MLPNEGKSLGCFCGCGPVCIHRQPARTSFPAEDRGICQVLDQDDALHHKYRKTDPFHVDSLLKMVLIQNLRITLE